MIRQLTEEANYHVMFIYTKYLELIYDAIAQLELRQHFAKHHLAMYISTLQV